MYFSTIDKKSLVMLVHERKNLKLLQLDNEISGALRECNDSILKKDQVYVLINDTLRIIFLWIGSQSGVRAKFIGSNAAQNIQRDRGLTHRVITVEEGEEPIDFIRSLSHILARPKVAELYI